ncbi:MAG: CsgG/HfaB family protein [Methylococcaceae bacterium]
MKKNPFVFTRICAVLLCYCPGLFCQTAFAYTVAPIAQIGLCTGDVQISTQGKKAQSEGSLLIGDTLETGDNQNSRCRITFPNGNALDMGSATKVRFDKAQQVTLLQGQLVAYAMPTLEQQSQPMVLHLGEGDLSLTMGKVFATVASDKRQIAIFNDLVSALWHDQTGDKTLYPGNLVTLSSDELDIAQTPRNMEAIVSEQMSPESPAVTLATQSFTNKDLATSSRLFQQIQQAFPYNAAAAYHLGLLDLNANKTSAAVVQWQKYVEIDPEAAKKNGVTQQLTLMTTKAIQDEVKQAIANENALSQLAPEPNSIAINPLINKGVEKYQPIGKGLTAFIITDLAKVPGLKVLEREKLQTLLNEIKLSDKEGLIEQSTRVRAGRMMRAETLMIGDYLIESTKGGQ